MGSSPKERPDEQHVRQGQGNGEPGGRQGEAGRRRSDRRSGTQGRGQGAGSQGRSAEGRRQRQVGHQEGGRSLTVAAKDVIEEQRASSGALCFAEIEDSEGATRNVSSFATFTMTDRRRVDGPRSA